MVASGPYVVLGGEFTAVNGVPAAGPGPDGVAVVAPRKQGPLGVTAGAKPAVAVHADRSVTVSWNTGWDRDDQTLTYTLWRGDDRGVAAVCRVPVLEAQDDLGSRLVC